MFILKFKGKIIKDNLSIFGFSNKTIEEQSPNKISEIIKMVLDNSKALDDNQDFVISIQGVSKENTNKTKKKERINGFVIPTIEEIAEYCKERNNNIDAEKFKNYYDSIGWVIGRNKAIKDWKACVRTWERNSYNSPQTRLQGKEVEFGIYQF